MSEQPAEYRTPGHRGLLKAEVDLIERIKAKEAELMVLVGEVNDITKRTRFRDESEGYRWASIAKTHFQEGAMALVRAVARPDLASE